MPCSEAKTTNLRQSVTNIHCRLFPKGKQSELLYWGVNKGTCADKFRKQATSRTKASSLRQSITTRAYAVPWLVQIDSFSKLVRDAKFRSKGIR